MPQALQPAMRAGVAVWQAVQAVRRALAAVNREQLWASRAPRPEAPSQSRRPATPQTPLPTGRGEGGFGARGDCFTGS